MATSKATANKHWNENVWGDTKVAVESGLPVLLWGPPGTGKTLFANTHAITEKAPLNITLTQGTPEAELRGHYMLGKDGAWHWHHGTMVRAMLEGRRVVVNEIQRCSEESLSFLLSALDMADPSRDGRLTVDLPNGSSVQPEPGYQVIATSNENPMDFDPALRDRFALHIEIPKPMDIAFKALGQLADVAMRHVNESPGMRKGSLRSWLAVSQLLKSGVDLDTALRMTMGEDAIPMAAAIRLALKPAKA